MIVTTIIFISLGLDTLAVALGIGMSGLPRSRWIRVGMTFAFFEGLMPIVGLLVGHGIGELLGQITTYIAGGILIIVGGLEIRESMNDDDAVAPPPVTEEWRQLILTGLSVSLDELAVGFALGVRGVSLGLSLSYIAMQAFALTFVGLELGQRLGALLKERAKLVAGIVLLVLGFAIILSELTGAHIL